MSATSSPRPADTRPQAARDPRLLALLGAATIAFSGIFVRLSHTSPTTAAFFRCLYAWPVLAALAAREDRRYGRRSLADRAPALVTRPSTAPGIRCAATAARAGANAASAKGSRSGSILLQSHIW